MNGLSKACPVFGKVKRRIAPMPHPKQQHPAIQIVDPRKRRPFPLGKIHRLIIRDPRGVPSPRRERNNRMSAANHAWLPTEGFGDRSHLRGRCPCGIERRHLVPAQFGPALGNRRVPPTRRIGPGIGVRWHNQGPFGPQHRLQRQNNSHRPPADPPQGRERGMHKKRHSRADPESPKVVLQ